MNPGVIAFIALFLGMTSYSQNIQSFKSDRNIQYDNYGRMISTETGERINYPFTGKFLPSGYASSGITDEKNPTGSGLNYCDPAWEYAIMGTSIGRNSLNTYDVDNDGTKEIICSAITGNYWGSWYVMKFNPETGEYYQDWISDSYENSITRMTLSDMDDDDIPEIFAGFDNGKVLIYDIPSKTVIGQIILSSGYQINDIHAGDADNDGKTEIVIADEEDIYLFDPVSLSLKSQIPYLTNEFSLGNVDADPEVEIVISNGRVIRYDGSAPVIEWQYDTYESYDNMMVELSDIDNDDMMEIVRARSWNVINVYDADTQTQKYEIYSDLDIQALLLKDVNGDNVDEILYGDGQWGSIHCIDAVSHAQLWEIENPEHGVTGLAVADVDNDGSLEVMWGSGWTSTGADYFYVAGIASHLIEWTSVAIDGPFYAVEISDVDSDGVEEIVCVSNSSESGYESGIISVFDSQTRELEWQCNGSFLYGVWTGIFNLEIADIDQDNVMEIIIAAGQTYTGKIWIINGISKIIESSYLYFNEDVDEFKVLNVNDIDDDGEMEIIAGNSSIIYVINHSTFAIEWNSDDLYGNYQASGIQSGNIDSDPDKEIVFCNGYIYAIDGISHLMWQSPEYNYTATELFDFNNDGMYEIIAGTDYGYFYVIDGNTHLVKSTGKVSNERIDGIRVADLNGDAEPELIFASDGRVYFYADTNLIQFTQRYAPVTGRFDGLKIRDIDGDGNIEVFAGTTSEIIEISHDCYSCLWFNAEPVINHVSCNGPDDGSIVLNVYGGSAPYTYSWSTGSVESALYNLMPGSYTYSVYDNSGCEIMNTVTIIQSQLITDYSSTDVSCDQINNGSATVHIIEGSPPYTYSWDTGDTTSAVSNLGVGIYHVNITDSKNCSSSETISISRDILLLDLYSSDVSCHGDNDGYIMTYISGGNPPYSYQWSNGAVSNSIYNLLQGEYFVTVSDNIGCSAVDTAIINEPPEILTQVTTTFDDPGTPFGEGTATINVLGGKPPYFIYWDDPFQQTGVTAINLTYGIYIVTVEDYEGCYKSDTAVVDSVLGVDELFNSTGLRFYPNPSDGMVYLELSVKGSCDVNILIHDFTGRNVYSENLFLSDNAIHSIDLSGLSKGLYCVSAILNEKRRNYTIELIK